VANGKAQALGATCMYACVLHICALSRPGSTPCSCCCCSSSSVLCGRLALARSSGRAQAQEVPSLPQSPKWPAPPLASCLQTGGGAGAGGSEMTPEAAEERAAAAQAAEERRGAMLSQVPARLAARCSVVQTAGPHDSNLSAQARWRGVQRAPPARASQAQRAPSVQALCADGVACEPGCGRLVSLGIAAPGRSARQSGPAARARGRCCCRRRASGWRASRWSSPTRRAAWRTWCCRPRSAGRSSSGRGPARPVPFDKFDKRT